MTEQIGIQYLICSPNEKILCLVPGSRWPYKSDLREVKSPAIIDCLAIEFYRLLRLLYRVPLLSLDSGYRRRAHKTIRKVKKGTTKAFSFAVPFFISEAGVLFRNYSGIPYLFMHFIRKTRKNLR